VHIVKLQEQIDLIKTFRNFTKKQITTFEKTYDVQKNNQIVINLPVRFQSKKKVRVTIEDIDETREEKIALLKKAVNDPICISDNAKIDSDFRDSENDAVCFQLGIIRD